MASRTVLLEKIQAIADRVTASEGLEVVELDLLGGGNSRTLRIFIDNVEKPGTVTHGDCENVSNQVGTILDVEDVIPGGGYTLEVSSPGVDRKLVRERDWQRFIGQKVKVVLKEAVEGQKMFIGRLDAYADGEITLTPEGGKKGTVLPAVKFPLSIVNRANLKFDW